MEVSIRKAESSDLNAILALFTNCIHDVCKKDYDPDQLAAWASAANNGKRWLDKIDRQYFIVAQIQNTIAGFSSLEDDTIDLLYVHKDFQNIGVASLLFKTLLERVRISGCQTLKSEVSKTARPFFEKQGFTIITGQTKIVEGVAIANYQMVKFL